jgi:hypothetical protein
MSTSPADEDRDPGAPEGAVFAPSMVRQARGARALAGIVVVAVGALIAIGELDRVAGPEPASVAVTSADPAPTALAPTALPSSRRSSRPPPLGSIAATGSQHGPPASDGLLQLDVRPAGSRLFVHGDVYSLEVKIVVLSIEDAAGHVADVRSVRLQGGSTAFQLGPNPRFDAMFDVPDELMGEGLWVQANAYDPQGRIIEAQLQPVVAPVLG